MFIWTDINNININIIPANEIFLNLSNKTPTPNPISRTPENNINSQWKGRKSGIIGK